MKNGLENKFVFKNNKKMAYGYTTGSCSAAASKAAAIMLFTKEKIEKVTLLTPKGMELSLETKEAKLTSGYAECAIQKEAGDDPDVTNGILVYAKVSWGNRKKRQEPLIHITGGLGIGKVTKAGLQQQVGDYAINKIPRKMIKEAVTEVCKENGYQGELYIQLSIPEGVDIAKKTFNPRLGIMGGISIIGTTGIVEPMSERALIESIRLEMQMYQKNGSEFVIIAPGNYGMEYLRENHSIDVDKVIKCSNFVGETVDLGVEMGFRGMLFVSNIGKFIKVAGGIMNTHSRNADARMELLAANVLRAGGDLKIAKKVLNSLTAEEGVKILQENCFLEPVMDCIMEKIAYYLGTRSYHQLEIGAVVFSNGLGEIGQTKNAMALMEHIKREMGKEKKE